MCSSDLVGVVKPSLLSGGCGSVRRALARSIRKVFLPITSSQACHSRSAEVALRIDYRKLAPYLIPRAIAPLVDGLMS